MQLRIPVFVKNCFGILLGVHLKLEDLIELLILSLLSLVDHPVHIIRTRDRSLNVLDYWLVHKLV